MSHDFPKIIWQTHNYTLDNMPDHVKMVCANWINLNPGWEYRYVSHIEREKFVRQYPEIIEYYLASPPKVQSDIWRCLITYRYGGSYADMDSVCIKPIDYSINEDDKDLELLLVPKEFMGGSPGIGNYVVKARSDVMKDVMDKITEVAKIKDLWEDEWLVFNLFLLSFKNKQRIGYNLRCALHSGDFHNVFPSDLEIDFYGKIMKYDEFVKKKKLEKILGDKNERV
jgi:hypothetical protein